MTRLQADLLLLGAAAIWGTAFIAQKTAMDHLDPQTFVAARGFIAALALAPLAIHEHRRRVPHAAAPGTLHRQAGIAGVLFFVGAALQQVGIVTASVTNTALLTVLYTVFTPLIAWVLLRRAPSRLVWPAVALSFVGTWLLGGGGLAPFGGGELLVILSAVFWAGHVVWTGVASGLRRPYAFNALQFLVVGLLGLGWMLATATPIRWPALGAALPELLYIGVLSSAVSFTLLTLAMRHTPPSEAAILVSSEIVFAAAAAWWLLGERLSWLGWSGAALILGAVVLLQAGPWVEARRRRGPAA